MQGEPSVRGGVDLAERPPVGAAIQPPMPPTDIRNPDYFHKVVDCQWACPAHTPVPEYIRLIAAGRYTDAYMVNWHSNVFPGILGRTCDRPCEPACRRGRVEDEPVAICRLKRVAADNKDDISRLPAQGPGGEERQARRAGRRRAGLADGRARPRAARLRHHHLRRRAARRRHDPQPDPALPPARGGDRRGGRLHRRHRQHRDPLRPTHRQPEGAARRGLRRGLRRHRRAARPRPRRPGPQGGRGATSISASTGSPTSPSAISRRSASASSCSAAATRRWIAAAPPAASAARRSRSSSAPASRR